MTFEERIREHCLRSDMVYEKILSLSCEKDLYILYPLKLADEQILKDNIPKMRKVIKEHIEESEAYTECLGMSYKDWIRHQENQRKELIEKEEKHKKEIPELTDYWIKEGHKVLSEDKWKLWDECVPIRLNDLYEGMELGCCLDIIKRIKEESIEAGIETMRNQGHSGMSWGLMKSMIKAFCDCGDEFLERLGD